MTSPDARLHFVGIAGAGMSALADYRLQSKKSVSGSDRFFDQGKMLDEKQRFLDAGAMICPQDGSGVEGADLVVSSTAVEAQIPDLVAANRLAIPIAHRAELLAAHVEESETIAIAGTSGKSTVVGMTVAALRAAKKDPATITGGALRDLASTRWRGNGHYGSGPLVIEADESDKSLVRYAPYVGVVLNLHKDHDETDAILPVFQTFRDQAQKVVLSEDANLSSLRERAEVFGLGPDASFRAENVTVGPDGSTFTVKGVKVRVPMPGRHNMLNALAALAAAHVANADLEQAALGIATFGGVARRFEILGQCRGVEVIDDFAHNPAKILAAMTAAKKRCKRLIAVFQPHGFGPTKFMRKDYVEAAQEALRPNDRIVLQEIFYAGGTVTKDISAGDLCRDMKERGIHATFFPDRGPLIDELTRATRHGDTIIVMGARDPSLGAFAQSILDQLAKKSADGEAGRS